MEIKSSNSIVVMPTFARPEILAHALQCLAASKDLPEVRIYMDSGGPSEKEVEAAWVKDQYLPTARFFLRPEHEKVSSGCWNILKSIEDGHASGADYVFLVEEDVLMKPDFMARHESLRQSGNYAATCGRRIQRFFERYGDMYTNPGSCLSRPLLDELVPHINADYFKHTGEYIEKVFGRGYINSSLDDGLVRMVCWKNDWKCGYPDVPICAHQGFDWYDEIDIYSNRGTIQERVEGFKRITDKIKPGDRYAKDFEPL